MANSNVGCEVEKVAQIVGSQSALARELDVAPATVNQWVKNVRPVPWRFAALMEELSKCSVSRQALAPSFPWHLFDELTPKHKGVV